MEHLPDCTRPELAPQALPGLQAAPCYSLQAHHVASHVSMCCSADIHSHGVMDPFLVI